MKVIPLPDDHVPSFCWDRQWTVREIKEKLNTTKHSPQPDFEWIRLASWILREAPTPEVWTFLDPKEIRDHLDELEPFLGRRKAFWRYLLGAWHEMGKL